MNYAEIRQNLISLGFAETTDLEEFDELGYTYSAINLAITQIGNEFPYEKTYEFEIDDTDEGILTFDFTDIDPYFLSFAETPVLIELEEKDYFKTFSNFRIEMGKRIVINADDNKGTFRVYYNALPTQFNQNTAETFTTELPLKVHHLIPLLAAYYLWLDDDERKATQYYNMYETELALILQKENEPKAEFIPDNAWRCLQ